MAIRYPENFLTDGCLAWRGEIRVQIPTGSLMNKIRIEEWWWEDDTTFCFKDKDTGEIWRCLNCWPKSLHVEGLDSDSSELCTIELTQRWAQNQQ